MNKTDGRTLSHETLEEIRIRAVQRVESGESPEVVIKALGFNRSQIYQWLALYREGGYEALRSRKAKGPEPKLNELQLQEIYDIVTTKNPAQLQFEFALWTRAMVRQLIRERFGVCLSEVSVGRLLRQLGLTPQKPLRRAYQQDPEKVKAWKETAFPEIRKLAKAEKAEIYFGDEASVRSDYHWGTTWAKRGETPVVEKTGARFSVNLVSAVNNRGTLRFMALNGRMNSDRFIEFLKRLIYNAPRPIFLVLDGHPVHQSGKVKEFVESTEGMLRLFILPPYSPNLNPDEWVWNWLKRHHLGKTEIKGPDQLKELVGHFLRRLQKLPRLIKGFFKDPELAYISAC